MKQKEAIRCEYKINSNLRYCGRDSRVTSYMCAWDLVVDGWKMEVKSADPTKQQGVGFCWFFNIHRHGILKESCDFYILRLQGIPGFKSKALHLLVKAPFGKKTLMLTFPSLLRKHHQYLTNFDDFASGKYGKKP
jgi:hypothetical protein